MDPSPGRFAMRNIPLRYAIEWAYDLNDYQVVGPDWIQGEDRYDIVANAPTPAADQQMKPMLQALLEERLKMKSHRETRTLPVYVLIKGKGAPKLKPATPGVPPNLSGRASDVFFQSQPVSRLTFMLSRRMGIPVLDQTGLNKTYDYTIDISGLNNFNPRSTDDAPGPTIFTAVQDDLGLKLESRKEPIEVLVIDSVDRIPTEN
jgi:uncharacterized protein (TIGR03435 family)